jgi:hypothetical protein
VKCATSVSFDKNIIYREQIENLMQLQNLEIIKRHKEFIDTIQCVLEGADVKPEYNGWDVLDIVSHFSSGTEKARLLSIAEQKSRKRYLETIHYLDPITEFVNRVVA